jgi:ComF family protein
MQVYNCLNFIRSTLFPNHCLLCGEAIDSGNDFCPGCRKELPFNRQACPQCALPLTSARDQSCGQCTLHPPPFTTTLAPLLYAPPFSHLISAFKFQHQLHLAAALGRLFVQQMPPGHPLPDLIVPVPLHPERIRERGFNQSLELARSLATALHLATTEHGCRRVIATPPQRGLDQLARRKNLRQAFRADPSVEGLHLALLDDVITTGATVTAASQSLLKAGARQVEVWALARTPLP